MKIVASACSESTLALAKPGNSTMIVPAMKVRSANIVTNPKLQSRAVDRLRRVDVGESLIC